MIKVPPLPIVNFNVGGMILQFLDEMRGGRFEVCPGHLIYVPPAKFVPGASEPSEPRERSEAERAIG